MDDKKLEQFLPYLEHSNVSAEMKMQILRDLCRVLESFVDEAWGTCPIQQGLGEKPDESSN